MLVRPKMEVRRSLRRGAEPQKKTYLKVRRSHWRGAEPLDHTPKEEWEQKIPKMKKKSPKKRPNKKSLGEQQGKAV